jgi:hypothetical protein
MAIGSNPRAALVGHYQAALEGRDIAAERHVVVGEGVAGLGGALGSGT